MAKLDKIRLSEEQAEQIIERGIDIGAYDSDIPDTQKEKLVVADEIIASSIDAYINDEIRPGDEDKEVAKAGELIEEVFAIAGITIVNGEAVLGEPVADADDDNSGDEEPFHPDDYIEGYTDLGVMSKLKKVKELDANKDEDAAILEALSQWENEQDKPSSRVLNYIDETLGTEADDDDADEPEADDENGDEPEAVDSDEESEEPWEGYDKATASQIKDLIKQAADDKDDPLTSEQVEYVLEYEQARKAPRKRVIDYCKALLAEFENGGSEPAKEAQDEPVSVATNGVITITREQILMALTTGEVQIAL